jgi:predicted transcriptional regulator
MTTITLQLTPELEQKLQESIARQDASSVRQLLADALAPTVEALLSKTSGNNKLEDEDKLEADLDRFLDEVEHRNGSILTLSDYALSRESIYEEHP